MDALIALIGVVVGAVMAGAVDYLVQKRRTAETIRREQAARTQLARAAALVAAMELAEEQTVLSSRQESGRSSIPSARDSVWTQRRELLAEHLGPVHTFPVALVFSLLDRARQVSATEGERQLEAARDLCDFARVEILLAYSAGKQLPPEELVNAALVAAGSPPLSRWLTTTSTPRSK